MEIKLIIDDREYEVREMANVDLSYNGSLAMARKCNACRFSYHNNGTGLSCCDYAPLQCGPCYPPSYLSWLPVVKEGE